MEWTKEKLLNTCILCTSKSHGERIVKFYRSFGFEEGYSIFSSKYDFIPGRIIGISTMSLQINKIDPYVVAVNPKTYKLIKLPSKPRQKFPREMLVSSNGENWYRRLVFCKLPKPISKFVANRHSPETKGMEKQNTFLKSWKYAKEID
jgi:hypothetical protein